MHLSKLEIHGFKSFANKLSLEFGARKSASFPVTAVVGPNGSGKSNVVDAIRWVLGEQSMKHLRGKKHEDIIFSGSETKSRQGYAEVSMMLNNSDHTMPLDLAEVVITRRLYRDGESEYLLNNRKVRLSDITMLLAQSHMGQRTYSVIGQGMVDHLLLATPRERKEMIDEAAGVRPYQLKRTDALNRLENTRTNLAQAQTVLTEIEPRLRTLTRMVKRLERRSELEVELTAIKREYYGSLWTASKNAVQGTRKRVEELEPTTKRLGLEKNQLTADLRHMEQSQPASTKLLELQRLYDSANTERESLKEHYWTLKSKLMNVPRPNPGAINLQQELERVVAEYDTLFASLTADPKSWLTHATELIGALKSLLKRSRPAPVVASTPTPEPTSPEMEVIQAKLTKAKDALEHLRGQMRAVEEDERNNRTTLFAHQDKLRTVERELETSQRALNELALERVRLETRHEDLTQEVRRSLNGEPDVLLAPPLPVATKPLPDMERDMRRVEHEIDLIGGIDPEVAKEYETTNERFNFLTKESGDLNAALKELVEVIKNLDETMEQQFERAFKTIATEFSNYFQELFGGGKAQLVLMENEMDDEKEPGEISEEPPATHDTPTIAGIDIQASPPGKRLKNISMLSGGEKTMTAIALLCAILSFHPSPFVVLDEVDAALDEANSQRYANILKQLSKQTQFIVITHNRTTMHIAETFYGVTMGSDGISQILSMKMEEAEEVAPVA